MFDRNTSDGRGKRRLRVKPTLAMTFALAFLGTGPQLRDQVLWDQSRILPKIDGTLCDLAAGCPPAGATVHCASDISLHQRVLVRSVSTWYSGAGDSAFADVTEAWLWVASRKGATPEPSDDPGAGGRKVQVRVESDDGSWRVVANGLRIALDPGEYWVALTPIASRGLVPPPPRHLARTTYGVPSARLDPCAPGGHTWSPLLNGRDATLRIEGSVLSVAPADPADRLRPWRLERR